MLRHKASGIHERAMNLASAQVPSPVRAAAPASPFDFARSLPPAVSVLQIVARVEETARVKGVVVRKLAVLQRAGTHDALGRVDLSVDLRGPYTAVKTTLRETLARQPSMSAAHLRIYSEPNAVTVDASATLSLWTSPFASPVSQSVHGPGHGR